MRHLAAFLLLVSSPLTAQVVVLDGVVSHLGTTDSLRGERSALLRIVTDAAWGDSTAVEVSAPLLMSGAAAMTCWKPTIP